MTNGNYISIIPGIKEYNFIFGTLNNDLYLYHS